MSTKRIVLRQEGPDMCCRETGAPFFALQYGSSTKEDLAREQSYRIISALKKENELILELNSSLFVIPAVRREQQALDYQKAFEDMGLEYRTRSGPAQSQALFSLQGMFGFGQKNQNQYEFWFHIPEAIWTSQRFRASLPIQGARYYVLRDDVCGRDALEKIFNGQMAGALKKETLSLNIFDCSLLGQMGIYSYAFEQSDLEDRLSGLLLR